MKNLLTLILFCTVELLVAQPCIPNTNSLSFDGIGAYVDMGAGSNLDTLTMQVTVEAWIRPASFGFNMAQNSIFCTHGWASGEKGYVLRAGGSGILSFNIAGLDTNSVPVSWKEITSAANTLQLNTWTHVAGTFSGTELKIYVNGSLAGSLAFKGTIVPSVYGAKIGKLADDVQSPGRYFDGNIDEVRVWNRALDSIEIAANANKHIDPSTATGLMAYYRFNEGTGTLVNDISGGNNNGSILNASWSGNVPFNENPPAPTIFYNGTNLVCNYSQNVQWYLGGTLITGTSGSTYTPTQNGTYTAIYTASNGCSSESQPFLLSTVGIENPEPVNGLTLWPNPNTGKLNISNRILSGDNREICIYDLQQKLVMHKVVNTNGAESIFLDLGELPNGIYQLTMNDSKEFVRGVFELNK